MTIVVCLVILASGGFQNLTVLSSVGYTTGYEGAKANFYGIEWTHEGKSGKQGFPLKGTMFHFDADEETLPDKGACNLEGEMTSVFLPEGSRPATWFDPSWWDTATEYITNPIEHYEWEITDENNVTTLYAMEEYKLKWYFSISAEWDYRETLFYSGSEMNDQRYKNTKVWFEFNLKPIWYFEGTSTAYFAIAKIRLSDISLTGKLGEKSDPHDMDDTGDPTNIIRVSPMSKSSVLPIYYSPYGTTDRAEKEAYTFQGKKLNPDVFTDTVYSYYTLADFGTEMWTEWGGMIWKWKGDVVTVGFDVHVLVVGEWKVKDIQNLPDDYGRTPKTGTAGGFAEFLARIIGSPAFQLWSFLGAIALIFLFIAIFAPWVLLTIFSLFRLTRKKS